MVPIDGEVREGVGLLGSPSFEIPRSVSATAGSTIWSTARSCAAASPPRTGTTAHHRRCSCSSRWIYSSRHACSAWPRWTSTTGRGVGDRAGRRPRPRCSPSSTSCWSSVPSPASGPCGPGTAPSTTRTSGGTSASGSCAAQPAADLQRHPVQEPDLAAAGRPDRQAASSTTAATSSRGPSSPSATTARSTPEASSSATRRRTAPSSPTASRSAPAARSGSAPSSTTASTMGDGAVLAADSFLMKGEEVPPHAGWGGNPPRPEIRDRARRVVSAPAANRDRWPIDVTGCGRKDDPMGMPRRPAGSTGAVCSSPADSPRSRGGPSTRCGRRRARGDDPDDLVAAVRRLADELGGAAELGAAGRARQGAGRAVGRARGRDRLRRRRRAGNRCRAG